MKNVISRLSSLLENGISDERLKPYEEVLEEFIEQAANEELFFELPASEIYKIVENSGVGDFDTIIKIASRLSQNNYKESIKLLMLIDSDEVPFDECVRIISEPKKCPKNQPEEKDTKKKKGKEKDKDKDLDECMDDLRREMNKPGYFGMSLVSTYSPNPTDREYYMDMELIELYEQGRDLLRSYEDLEYQNMRKALIEVKDDQYNQDKERGRMMEAQKEESIKILKTFENAEHKKDGFHFCKNVQYETSEFYHIDVNKRYNISFKFSSTKGERTNPDVFVSFYDRRKSPIKRINMNLIPNTIHEIRSVDKGKLLIEIKGHVNAAWRKQERGYSYYVAVSDDPNFSNYAYFHVKNGISFEDGFINDDLIFKGSSIPDCAKSGRFIALFAFANRCPYFILYPRFSYATSHGTVAFEKDTKYIKISIGVASLSKEAEIIINNLEISPEEENLRLYEGYL